QFLASRLTLPLSLSSTGAHSMASGVDHGVIRSPWETADLLENREALKEISMSRDHHHLNQATYACQYRVAFTPKYRAKPLYPVALPATSDRGMAPDPMPDHVHLGGRRIGFLQGKSPIWIAENVERQLRNCLGHKMWARLLRFDRGAGRGDDWRNI